MFSAHFSSRIRQSREHVPVTVKLISEAQPGSDESNFVINGYNVTNVTVVGMVLNKNARVTDASFTLGDGTGQISCTIRTNEAYETNEMEDLQDGMYVRINGHLRSYQGKQQLVAFSVRPVTDFDEVINHHTECKQYQLKNKKAKMQGDFKISSSQSGGPIVSTHTQNGSEGSQISALSEQFSVYGPKGLDQMVLDYLQQPSICELSKGVHRDELSKKLKIPMEKIIETTMNLEDEGLIYSTIDEFHFKATTCDGADGKCTWGKLLDTEGETHLDHNDPNYATGEVIQTADKSSLSAPHHAELVEKRWGIEAEVVKKKISGLLREYVESGDTFEACRCIRELGLPFIYHEVVKQALILAMKTRAAEPSILNLLKEASAEGLISSSQMGKGFTRLANSLDNLVLDIPSARSLFQSLVPRAISEGWLDEWYLKHSTEDGELFEQFSVYEIKKLDKMVLDYLQQPSICELPRGVHRDELSKKLKIPMENIIIFLQVADSPLETISLETGARLRISYSHPGEAAVSLKYNGLIYSTIDEFHFKAAPPYVLKEFDQMVLDYLQQPSICELRRGVHRDELSEKLKIPMEKIMETTKRLKKDGLIFSIIDDFHFKAAPPPLIGVRKCTL